MKDLGKPGAGEPHARFDERGLETEHGLGTAAPAALCVDSAGPIGHRASPRLYPRLETPLDESPKQLETVGTYWSGNEAGEGRFAHQLGVGRIRACRPQKPASCSDVRASAEAGSEPARRCTSGRAPMAIEGLALGWAQLRRTTSGQRCNERSCETSSPRLSEGVRPQ